jgi:hypothetical protein
MRDSKQYELVENVKECFCGGLSQVYGSTPKIRIYRCKDCKSLQAEFSNKAEGLPWEEEHTSSNYSAALRFRREEQVRQIVNAITASNFQEPILDYGCGQGVFVNFATESGLSTLGVDINPQFKLSNIRRLNHAWEIPTGTWPSAVLLDVIEHHDAPVAFLRSLNANQLLLKVPSSEGPSAILAKLFFRANNPALLERLFLSDDPHPHYWLFSRKGLRLLGVKAGYSVKRRIRVTEFGRELPSRIRITDRPVRRFLVGLVGRVNEVIGKYWSDTIVFLFEVSED